ncbi:VIT1/CCC1 transporter family protein [Nioella nitratireducens]|uniref:VIT1/CCC1 transporter family protein n=1 Tax=Nioella nitratireducens TaxID=1287720 RepID=UPI0008FCE216|nr:VIT1/CCC1 transporter family protein [Nioella nitratireducens]
MAIDWVQHRQQDHKITRAQEFLKQIVYGGNDGIVTTFAIVAGFAGASSDQTGQIGALAVLVFGLANLFADGVSMGLGEFLSGRSQRDLYHARRTKELSELATDPAGERTEMKQLLRERGLSVADARTMTDILMRNHSFAADLMMTYEFEMPDPASSTPLVSGLYTFAAFLSLGGIPLVPYLIGMPLEAAFPASVAATTLALFGLGVLRWRATGEAPARSILETMGVGGLCSVVAYIVGALVG